MKRNFPYQSVITLAVLLLMSISACSVEIDDTDGSYAPKSQKDDTLTVVSTFLHENGLPLTDSTVQITSQNDQNIYFLDADGSVQVSEVPRESNLTFTLLDEEESQLGSLSLQFVKGMITDASTGSENRGRVTVKYDVAEVSLIFTLMENGGMQCALDLPELLDA